MNRWLDDADKAKRRANSSLRMIEMLDSASGALISSTMLFIGVVEARSMRLGPMGKWSSTISLEWAGQTVQVSGYGDDPQVATSAALYQVARFYQRAAFDLATVGAHRASSESAQGSTGAA